MLSGSCRLAGRMSLWVCTTWATRYSCYFQPTLVFSLWQRSQESLTTAQSQERWISKDTDPPLFLIGFGPAVVFHLSYVLTKAISPLFLAPGGQNLVGACLFRSPPPGSRPIGHIWWCLRVPLRSHWLLIRMFSKFCALGVCVVLVSQYSSLFHHVPLGKLPISQQYSLFRHVVYGAHCSILSQNYSTVSFISSCCVWCSSFTSFLLNNLLHFTTLCIVFTALTVFLTSK